MYIKIKVRNAFMYTILHILTPDRSIIDTRYHIIVLLLINKVIVIHEHTKNTIPATVENPPIITACISDSVKSIKYGLMIMGASD